MMAWDYGNAYEDYPIQSGTAVFKDGSVLKTHDIFNPLPEFMLKADLVFVDPPWNQGNISTFYMKAERVQPAGNFESFCDRLFDCIKTINPHVCYVEIGKQYLSNFMERMNKIYKYVVFYNSTYYHNKRNLCYVVRGSNKYKKPSLDGMDEEDIIEWICQNEEYSCIGDLCMGRGLVAVNAHKAGKLFVGTEMNHKRLSVTLQRLSDIGAEYSLESPNFIRESREKKKLTQSEVANIIGLTLRQYQRYESGALNIGAINFRSGILLAHILDIEPETLLAQSL